jgi:uncharacterized LabA/DUF88 family protein
VGKNVAVFVDVANIFYAAKAAGVDIDYVTLLKSATAGRDFVRAYAYTGLDPENENQRNFHAFLARNHYKVVSKDIRKYGDGKVKANLDIELVVDLMKTARNLDIAIVVSGDGDFAPAIRAVQEMGVRVEVISFRGNTSSDLIDVADLFTDITQLARVDKSSSRSGRRVAGDEEDLSMTEVPDKQTEGTGTRGRGRGRGRGRAGEAEPVAATSRRRGSAAAAATTAASANGGGPLSVLPGEKLSRVAATAVPGALEDEDEAELDVGDDVLVTADADGGDDRATDGEGRRRRRRRGGRGRGRGRGRGDEAPEVAGLPAGAIDEAEDEIDEPEDIAAPPRAPRATAFGSFWDSQLGVPSAARGPVGPVSPVGEEEDFDEPEIPEYLIAEQRRGRQGQGQGQGRGGGRGGRGGRSAYTAAIERERFGRGGGSGGINRYPDVSGRTPAPRGGGGGRDTGYVRRDRPDRAVRPDRPPRTSGGDPWSEVPPELEEMLRAQLAQSGKSRPATPARRPEVDEAAPLSVASTETAAETPAKRRTATRRPTRAASATAGAAPVESTEAGDVGSTGDAAPKRRTTRRTSPAAASDAAGTEGTAEAAPKRRTTRRSAASASASTAAAGTADGGSDADTDTAAGTAAPKRRATRKKAEPA